MAKDVRGKRASPNQKEYLINWLEENIDIANDKFVSPDGARLRDTKWKELATNLNALGGTQKDGPKWRKYWSDLRLNTRAKYSTIKEAEQRSGVNGMGPAKALTPLEERIIKVTTIEAVDGDETPEIGFVEFVDNANNALTSTAIEICESPIMQVECALAPTESACPESAPAGTNTMRGTNISTSRGPESAPAGTNTMRGTNISTSRGPESAPAGTNTMRGTNISTSRGPESAPAGTNTMRGTRISTSSGRKRKTQSDAAEKLLKIEEKKLKQRELANALKQEEIAAIREQTEAIRAGNEIKAGILSALNDLVKIYTPECLI